MSCCAASILKRHPFVWKPGIDSKSAKFGLHKPILIFKKAKITCQWAKRKSSLQQSHYSNPDRMQAANNDTPLISFVLRGLEIGLSFYRGHCIPLLLARATESQRAKHRIRHITSDLFLVA